MRTSQESAAVFEAIGEVQAAVPFVDKTDTAKIGADYSYKFAPHDLVWEAVRHAMRDNKLVPSQGGREGAGASHWMVTRVTHTPTGQFVEADTKIETAKAGMQALGAVLSYTRRVSLLGLLGIVARGEDKDAQDDHAGRSAAPRVSKAARPSGFTVDSEKAWEDAIAEVATLTTAQAIDDLSRETSAKWGAMPKGHAMFDRVKQAFSGARTRVAKAAQEARST